MLFMIIINWPLIEVEGKAYKYISVFIITKCRWIFLSPILWSAKFPKSLFKKLL